MIEGIQRFPLLRDVARFASQIYLRIDLMRIGVTCAAIAGGEVILTPGVPCRALLVLREGGGYGRHLRHLRGGIGNGRWKRLVTLDALDHDVTPGQGELSQGVALDRKGSFLEPFFRVAQVALVDNRL